MNIEFREEILSLKEKVSKASGKQVVFYGSSSIRLWESLETDFDELDCLNIAFGGSTIKDCIDSYSSLLKQAHPSQVVFYAGDNDLGQEVGVEETYNRFVTLYNLIREDYSKIPFVFVSVKPSLARVGFLDQIIELNTKIETFLWGQDNATYVDVFNPMMEGKEIRTDLFVEDQLHMNKKGYTIWRGVLRDYFQLK